jgi:pyruvate/2-oxoglutarate dehydrogenase complex dihydrolipoamide acyltransferase (E2) component
VAEAAGRCGEGQDEPIASLETDKVAVEVPSPVAGTMGEQLVKEGDTVAVGAAIATIEAGGAGAAAKPAEPAPAPAAKPPDSTPVNPKGPGENVEVKDEDGEEEDGPHLTCRRRCGGSCSSGISIPRRSRAPARTAG